MADTPYQHHSALQGFARRSLALSHERRNIDLLMDGVNEDCVHFGTGKATPAFTQGPTIPVSGECPAVGDLNGDESLDFVVPDGNEQRARDHLSRQW